MSTRRQAKFTSHFSIHDPLLFQSVCVNIYFYTCTHTQTHGCPALYMWNIYVSLCGCQWFPSIADDFFPQSHRRSGWNPSLRCEPVWSALSIREAVCVCVSVCECVCVCVCLCVWVCGERGWREECLSAWQRERSGERLFQCWRWSCVDATPGCAREKRAYSRFYDCLLWLCLSGPVLPCWPRLWSKAALLCWNEEAQAGRSGNSQLDSASDKIR